MRALIISIALCASASAQILSPIAANVLHAGGVPITLLTHTAAGIGAGQDVTTSPIDTTGASLYVASLTAVDGGNHTIFIDNSSMSTWNCGTYQSASGTSIMTQLCWAIAPATSGAETFHAACGPGGMDCTFPCIAVASFANSKLSGAADQANGADSAGASTTKQPGSITPTENTELVVSGIAANFLPTASSSIDSGMSITDFIAGAGVAETCGLAYATQTTATAINPTWTNSTSTDWAATIQSFKAQTP